MQPHTGPRILAARYWEGLAFEVETPLGTGLVIAAPMGGPDDAAGGGGDALPAGGLTGLGAETPAMLDPSPSF